MSDLEETCKHEWEYENTFSSEKHYYCKKCGKDKVISDSYDGPCAEGHDFEEDMGGNLRCKNCGYRR